MKKNFALIGVGGYIAPRHLQAIRDTGNRLIAAVDKHDSVGIIDSYFPEASFFTEFERFDRHAEKLRRKGEGERIHYVSICSPNYLHDAHIRFALRIGATPICEKPLVINPWNLDQLKALEDEYGKKVFTVLQLRKHPTILALKEKFANYKGGKIPIDLAYITGRGKWYFISWKGDIEKSGGVGTNIGIHFFDMLIWIFGKVQSSAVFYANPSKMLGYLELEKATVRWFLSVDLNDVPAEARKKGKRTYRAIRIGGDELEFSDGFTDLHTEVYRDILNGVGPGIEESRPSIQLAYDIRHAMVEKVSLSDERINPLGKKILSF